MVSDYINISMFNQRNDLKLEKQNMLGYLIHSMVDGKYIKYYISYIFNDNNLVHYNYFFRKLDQFNSSVFVRL